jgi:hypothetical protein
MASPDWVTISSLATGAGTLVLAVSTFAAVRSANRAARIAEQSLLIGLRPLLVPSRLQDLAQKVFFIDGKYVVAEGGSAGVEIDGDVIYLAISLRNAGSGIGVLHGWRFQVGRQHRQQHPDLAEFRMLNRDIYLPPSDIGFWQGAFREPDDPLRESALQAIKAAETMTIDVLYGDHEGGQRAISRFVLQPRGDQPKWMATVAQHWNVDRPDPR